MDRPNSTGNSSTGHDRHPDAEAGKQDEFAGAGGHVHDVRQQADDAERGAEGEDSRDQRQQHGGQRAGYQGEHDRCREDAEPGADRRGRLAGLGDLPGDRRNGVRRADGLDIVEHPLTGERRHVLRGHAELERGEGNPAVLADLGRAVRGDDAGDPVQPR
jgi:hypothetical protein